MRFEIPEKKKLVYEMTFPVRWGDMDVAGHVNNTMYFRYLETVRLEWLRSIDELPDPQGSGIGPLIVNGFCSFMKQVTYPDDLLAKLYVGEVGRSSFDTYITLERTVVPDVVHAAGGATIVWVNFKEEKSLPVPEHVRELIL